MTSTSRPTSSVRGSRQAASSARRRAAGSPSPVPSAGADRNPRAPSSVPARTSADSTGRCSPTGTSNRAATAPSPAPATEPRLQAAWNRGRMVRPRRFSTAAPSTFIATSHRPEPKPNAASPSPTPTTDPARLAARPAPVRPSETSTTDTATVRADPRRWATRPAVGMASREPADTQSSSSPSRLGLRSSASRAAGTRENQLATASPLRAKTTATPLRAVSTARGAGGRFPAGTSMVLLTLRWSLPPSGSRRQSHT